MRLHFGVNRKHAGHLAEGQGAGITQTRDVRGFIPVRLISPHAAAQSRELTTSFHAPAYILHPAFQYQHLGFRL